MQLKVFFSLLCYCCFGMLLLGPFDSGHKKVWSTLAGFTKSGISSANIKFNILCSFISIPHLAQHLAEDVPEGR